MYCSTIVSPEEVVRTGVLQLLGNSEVRRFLPPAELLQVLHYCTGSAVAAKSLTVKDGRLVFEEVKHLGVNSLFLAVGLLPTPFAQTGFALLTHNGTAILKINHSTQSIEAHPVGSACSLSHWLREPHCHFTTIGGRANCQLRHGDYRMAVEPLAGEAVLEQTRGGMLSHHFHVKRVSSINLLEYTDQQ